MPENVTKETPTRPPHAQGRAPNGPDTSHIARLKHHSREVRDEARMLASGVEDAVDELGAFLREQMERSPYATVAAAAGIGYVLGGGVPSRLTRLVLDLGTRVGLTMLIQQFSSVSARPSAEPPSSRAWPEDQQRS